MDPPAGHTKGTQEGRAHPTGPQEGPDPLGPQGAVLPLILPKKRRHRVRLRALARVAAIAVGIQFGWALQLSLLTPYVQELGIPHAWASYIWLCGPITGMIVQPLIGVWSDTCEASWGRRRPFIVAGAAMASASVTLIGFSADLGALLGDPVGPTSIMGPKWIAVGLFIFGFWLLDLSNNTLQGPCRALLADLTGKEGKRNRRANAYFSAFMALGNILGFAAGAYPDLHTLFLSSPLILTQACDPACANLKTAFLLHVLVLAISTALSVTAAKEVSLQETRKAQQRAAELLASLLPPPLESVLPIPEDLAAQTTPLLTASANEAGPSYGTFSAPSSPSAAAAAAAAADSLFSPGSGAGAGAGGDAATEPLLGQEGGAAGGGVNGGWRAEEQPLLGAGPAHGTGARGRVSTIIWGGLVSWLTLGAVGSGAGAESRGRGRVVVGGREEEEDDEEDDEDEEGEEKEDEKKLPLWEIAKSLNSLPRELLMLLLVTALTWLALFPFLLFDTDWMGREVFQGAPDGTPQEVALYYFGVHWGAFGLVLNSVVQGTFSFMVDPLVRRVGSRTVWAAGNAVLSLCLLGTLFVNMMASSTALAPAEAPASPSAATLVWAIVVFAALGIPLSITYSIPYSLAAIFTSTEGGGQGAAMGVLNMAVVVPQMFVSVAAGPFDEAFGSGNIPAFMASAFFAALAAAAAFLFIPKPPADSPQPQLTRTISSPFP